MCFNNLSKEIGTSGGIFGKQYKDEISEQLRNAKYGQRQHPRYFPNIMRERKNSSLQKIEAQGSKESLGRIPCHSVR